MAQVNYSEGVAETSPSNEGTPYQSGAGATPDAFGAGIGQGLEKLGHGASTAGKFYGQVAADDASNNTQDFVTKVLHGDPNKTNPDGTPDLGYLGLKGAAAMAARKDVAKQIDDYIKQARDNLSTPESQLQFDNFSKRFRSMAYEKMGAHADTQSNAWYKEVNTASYALGAGAVARDADNPELAKHGISDMVRARVQQAELHGAVKGDPVWNQAVESAMIDGVKIRAQSLGATDPVKALKIAEDNKRGLGQEYGPLVAQLQPLADRSEGVSAAKQYSQGTTAVNQDVPQEGRALLDHIAGPESGGRYDVRYGGAKFNGFADHPRISSLITSGPDAGKTSSAAGRYQFLGSTWDAETKKLGLKDFSPANQDAAAWDLAQTEYKAKTGNDLLTVLRSGDHAAITAVPSKLSGQWSSLPGGRQPSNTAQFSPSGHVPSDPYQKIRDDPNLTDGAKTYAYGWLNQKNAADKVEKQTVSKLVTDDLASITSTGMPIPGLTTDRAAEALGPAAALEMATNRGIAQNYFQQTHDWPQLSASEIYDRVQALTPDPGKSGFSYAQELHQHASETADALIKNRYDDPAGAVANMPDVRAAKAASAKDFMGLVKARLLAQTKLGLPDGAQSPIPDDEAKQYAALMRPVAKGQADVQNQEQVIGGVVKEINEKYGPYAQPAMARVLYHVTMKQDAADVLSAAMQRYANKETPPLVTPDEARRAQVERDSERAAQISGALSQQETAHNSQMIMGAEVSQMPVDPSAVALIVQQSSQPKPKPFWQAVDLLRSDPAKLMPMFVKRFGAESVPPDMRQYLEQPQAK